MHKSTLYTVKIVTDHNSVVSNLLVTLHQKKSVLMSNYYYYYYYYLSGNEEFQTHSLFMTGFFFFQHGIKELVECFNSCHVAGHVSFMLVVFLALVSEMQWYS